MPVGATVRIVTGPLTGIVGTVVRRGKRDQFIAMVNFLGRGAMVDLQDWQVERVIE
jgi:transcriptional antiterminator RfaH